MPSDHLMVDRHNGITTLTLNRPEALNAISAEMAESLLEALEGAQRDLTTRVIVLTGAGETFCVGGDVRTMAERSATLAQDARLQLERLDTTTRRIPIALRRIDLPVVAMVNGTAAHWGCDLALACDLRIASNQASFTETFVKQGLVPDGGAIYILPRLIGTDRALELMWTGAMIDAAKALELGMVTHVVPHEELISFTHNLAERIAAMAPLAVRAIKRAVYREATMDLSQAMEHMALYLNILRQSADHVEGVRALLEQRAPLFKGR